MARRAPAPADPDEGDIPPDPMTAEDGNGKPVRKSAQGAHKVWEDLKPKSRAPKPEHDKEKKKKKGNMYAKPGGAKRVVAPTAQPLATKYPAPNINLNTSDDESPPPRTSRWKKASATSSDEGSDNELDVEDEAPVKSEKSRFGPPKGKGKASTYQSAEDGSSDSGEGERPDDEDEEEESGPSGLEELEETSALQAKFDNEAPTWVDGGDPDFDGDFDLFPPSPVVSSGALPTRLDTIDRSPSKRPRAVSSDASEKEDDVQTEPRPSRKKAKAAATSAAGRGKGREDDGEDADESAPSMDEQTDLVRDKAAERRRVRKREEERERARERKQAERAKERANERERQRRALKKFQEHAKECERRDREERKQEEERQRKKERERERDREQEKVCERKLKLALEMEREYEREHEEVRRQVLGRAKKHPGRNERERDETEDEAEEGRNMRPDKRTRGSRPGRSEGPSRSSTSNKTGSRTQNATPSSKGSHLEDVLVAGAKTKARPLTKRKRGKQDEEIRFVSDKGSSGSDDKAPPRKRRQDDEAPPSSDEDDKNIDLIWFGNSRPNLTNQHPRVKQVANLAIADCELNVCTINAFPDDPDGDGCFMRDILVKHANALGYKDMVRKLKDRKDSTYWKKFSTIPSQRVFLLRGKVKGKCEGAVRAAYDLRIGDTEKVAWLQKDLVYIYPHDYKNRTVNGKEGFKLPIFENMLIAAFFSRRQSYGHRISKHFKSSHPDKPDEKEIPAPMLALVSTAIFAAIDDFKHAHYDAAKFEVNLNLHVYRRNMTFLDHIKDKNIDAFHTLMHGLFKHVMGGVGGASNSLGHGMGYLDVDGMDRE